MLADVVYDMHDKLKSATRGYGTMDYELLGYRPGELIRLDILVKGDRIDALGVLAVVGISAAGYFLAVAPVVRSSQAPATGMFWHPDGPQEGELYDLRHYTPGDPIRFVLWKVFARSRQLVVRSPERALSPIRQTCAYLVAGEGDEPAAGAARLAVMHGSLGNDWVLGADGSHEDAKRRDQAIDLLARSANVGDKGGTGLAAFLERRGSVAGKLGRAVVFVPGRPGPWLDAVLAQCRGIGGRGGRIEFVVGTDGIAPAPPKRWFARLALRERTYEVTPGAVAPVTTEQVGEVIKALSAIGRVIVIDRMAGRMFADGHLAALTKPKQKQKSRSKTEKQAA